MVRKAGRDYALIWHETLDTDFCFGLAEDMVGLYPWWDGWKRDTGAAFQLNKFFTTISSAQITEMLSSQFLK